jgi:lambda family phage minor tail protein L
MFEIDISDILFETGALNEAAEEGDISVFRFHNAVKQFRGSIIWQGKEYFPAPIRAEGFELTTKGTLPVPKLSITSNDEGVPLIAILRDKISLLGDLIGARVTRIRTFAKFLDEVNFINAIYPPGFEADPNAEFPRDVYYVDRKSIENKSYTEYELASIFDLSEIKLPNRVVYAERCGHTYRGEGCLYEYRSRIETDVHGDAILPLIAPPRATANDEEIWDILDLPRQASIIERGEYSVNLTYSKGDAVYIEKNGIKYYFVAKVNSPTLGPPNLTNWVPDQCSHTCQGCKLRWFALTNDEKDGSFYNRQLPYGGFLAANKVS